MEEDSMDTSTLRAVLERSGLTQYEADAYITLVDLGSATAVEISEASDVPQARIYDVLRELEGKGYVETYKAGSLRAQANDPAELAREITAQAELMTEAADELEERWEEPAVESQMVTVVKRYDTVFDRAREAIDDAEYEVELSASLSDYERLREDLAAAYDRGAIVKVTITAHPTASPIENPEERFSGVATEVRLRRLPTAFLVLTDRTEVCFAPTERLPNDREYGLLVDDYTLSQIFAWYYQTAVWESWDVIYTARRDELPATYTEIRNCLEDIVAHVEVGDSVFVTVVGTDRTTGKNVTLEGRVVDTTYNHVGDHPSLMSHVNEANMTLVTDHGPCVVGGAGALLEDIEAHRIVVERIEEN